MPLRRTVLLMLPVLTAGAECLRADNRFQDWGRFGSNAVYLMTNQADNSVMVFRRGRDGMLTRGGTFATGGRGGMAPSGNALDPLASQGALILSPDQHLLFAVNAGSNEISVMAAILDRLILLEKVSSGGQTPVSLTLHRGVLYVLNAGGVPNITGFRVSRLGKLSPIAGSTRPLSGGASAQPAQVSFSPDGDLLVVTEKMTNMINTYAVDDDEVAGPPMAHRSNGMTPFGFAFARPETLIVSEAFGGAPMQSAVSSYRLSDSGGVQLVSGSVANRQTASCWVAVTRKGRYAYVTNTGNHVVSGYGVSGEGRLTLLNASGVAASTGADTNPIDMAVAGAFLYVHLAGPGGRAIVGYRVGQDGALSQVTRVNGLPAGAQGIAAR